MTARRGLGDRRPVASEDLSFLTNYGGGPDRSTEIEHLPLGQVDESADLCLRQRPFPGVDALADQIRKHGQTTPVFVRPVDGGRYELISGYRRRAALEAIGSPTILARVYRNLSTDAAFDLAVSENADRDDLTDWERALACKRLVDGGKPAAEVARMFNWTDDRQVRNHVRIAKEAPPPVAAALQRTQIKATHARVLLRLSEAPFDEADAERFTAAAIEKGLSVRGIQDALDKEIERRKQGDKPKTGRAPEPVRVKEFRGGGFQLSAKVTVESTPEELDMVAGELRRLLRQISKLKKEDSGED